MERSREEPRAAGAWVRGNITASEKAAPILKSPRALFTQVLFLRGALSKGDLKVPARPGNGDSRRDACKKV